MDGAAGLHGRSERAHLLRPDQLVVQPTRRRTHRGGQRTRPPHRQGLRKAGVGDPRGRGAWPYRARGGTGSAEEAVLPAAALQALHRRCRHHLAVEGRPGGAGGGAVVGPSRHPAARHRAHAAAQPQGVRDRLGGRPHGAGVRRRLQPGRLRGLRGGIHPPHRRREAACDQRLPADRARAGRRVADGRAWRSHTALAGDDGRPDRCTPQSHRSQRPGHAQSPVVVRAQRHPHGADALPGRRPPRVSRFPAARRLHRDESQPPLHVALGLLQRPGEGRPSGCRIAPQVLRRVQRRAGHAGRVLPGHHPYRVPGIPAAARHVEGQ